MLSITLIGEVKKGSNDFKSTVGNYYKIINILIL